MEQKSRDPLVLAADYVDPENGVDSEEQALEGARQGFKKGYFMGAHFMDEGSSPHKESLEEVKEKFIRAFSNNRLWTG